MRKPLTEEQKIARAEYKRKYYLANKERLIKEQKEYYQHNKENKQIYDKQYRVDNKDKLNEYKTNWKNNNYDKVRLINQKYRELNKCKIKEYKIMYKYNQRLTNPLFKLKEDIRSMVNSSMNNKGYVKTCKTVEILGCSFEEFKIHIESLFEPWMNWGNKGNWCGYPKSINISWDIDHIEPLNNAKTEDDVYRLNHYTNLQPLCSYTNRHIKKDKFN